FSIVSGRVTELSVRLPSALFAIGGMLVCYLYTRRLFDDSVALLAAVMLGTTFQYLQAGTGARVDMTLSFFSEIAFFEFLAIAEGLPSRRMLWFTALAFAVLAKGPVGLVLPAATAIAWIALERRGYLIGDLRLARGLLLLGVVGGSWYVAASWVGGMDFIRKQILSENLTRFVGGESFREGHAHPFYYLELTLLVGFLPWTAMFPIAIVQAWRSLRMTPRVAYLATWVLVVLFFYSLAHS